MPVCSVENHAAATVNAKRQKANTLRGDGAADDVSGSRCRQSAPKTSSATGCIPMLSSVVCSVLSDQSTGRRDSSRRASETEAARKKTQAMQTRENV